MRQRDRGSATDSESYGPLFGSDDDEDDTFFDRYGSDDDHVAAPARPLPTGGERHRHAAAGDSTHGDASYADVGDPRRDETARRAVAGVSAVPRSQRSHQARKKHNRRVFGVLTTLVVLILAVATWLVVIPLYHYFSPSDYSGDGSGSVRVTVQADDGAADIADALKAAGVVASDRAFTDAAGDNSASRSIQPGVYVLHKHMSGTAALKLLLTPSARENDDVLVTEGATTLDVAQRLEAKPCSSSASSSTVCGPGLDAAAVQKAFKDVAALGLPTDFTVDSKTPSSAEGFLYPATYFFPSDTTPSAALVQMITKFTEQARTTQFSADAKALHVTPYQLLTIASIAQSEAKYPADMAKVARVILNRLTQKKPLQIDATSAYGAKLQGLDPTTINFANFPSPYNSYNNAGLPPTPISNPGSDALTGAAHPTAGNWLYYVNSDAAGHLFFTNSESAFETAAATCKAHNWGCG